MRMADKIVMRPTAALIPYANNARTHSDAQIAQIAASIREFGFTNPVLVDGEQGIVAGHARVLASRKLGIAEIPTIELAYLSAAQRKAYILADNKLAENAGWDAEMLGLELRDLKELGFDLELTGFDELELQSLLADKTEGLTDPDDVPEVPEHPVSRPGDLWLLGRHRLLCGDSTVATDVERVLGGHKANLCLTDPPYGIGESFEGYGEDSIDKLVGLIDRFLPIARARCEVVLLTPGNRYHRRYPNPTWTLAWFVSAGTGVNPWGFTCWNAILAYGKDPYLARRKGSRPDAFILTKASENSLGHPCPKPVEVWQWLMERGSTSPGDLVFDPFCGSGTGLIAAEKSARRLASIEIAATYVDVAVKRWQDFSGKIATLDDDGRTFDEIAAARAEQAAA